MRTAHLELIPFSPEHLLGLLEGEERFEESFGLPAAEGPSEFFHIWRRLPRLAGATPRSTSGGPVGSWLCDGPSGGQCGRRQYGLQRATG